MYSSSDMSRISSSFNCTPTARTTRLLGARGFGGGGACFGVAAGFTGDFATAAVFDGLPLFCTLAFPASDFAIFLGAGRAAGLAAVGVFFATDLAGLPFNAFVSFLIRPPLDGAGFFAAADFLATGLAAAFGLTTFFGGRSEERRVGKELFSTF